MLDINIIDQFHRFFCHVDQIQCSYKILLRKSFLNIFFRIIGRQHFQIYKSEKSENDRICGMGNNMENRKIDHTTKNYVNLHQNHLN